MSGREQPITKILGAITRESVACCWSRPATGARSPRGHGGRASSPGDPESVLHGFGEELRWCLQVVGAEQDGVLDAHGLAAHRGELRDDVLGGGVVRERGQVRGGSPVTSTPWVAPKSASPGTTSQRTECGSRSSSSTCSGKTQ